MTGQVVLGDAGLLSPGRWRWARALASMLLLAVLCIFTFNFIAEASLRAGVALSGETFTTRADAPVMVRLTSAVLGCLAMLAVYATAVRFGERRSVSELALPRLLAEIALGVLIGGGLIALVIAANWAAGWAQITAVPTTDITEALRQTLRSAIVEEVLMRLIVFRLLWRAFGIWPAMLLAAAVFGALHLGNPDATWFSSLSLFAGEGVAIGLYLLTGRIWATIGFHAGWNFAQGWLFGAAVSGVEGFDGGPLSTHPVAGIDPALSGGGFGPEASLACFILSLAASAIALWLAWRKTGFAAR